MSATMDVTSFAQYFDLILPNRTLQLAPHYEIKRENPFTVQVHYLNNLASIGTVSIVFDTFVVLKELICHLLQLSK